MLSKVQLQTIVNVVANLNYYQVLKLSPLASDQDIRNAFHREALSFHPDRYQPLNDPETSAMAKQIYAKVVDAYRTLSNRARRELYDAKLTGRAVSAPAAVNTTPHAPMANIDEDAVTSAQRKPIGSGAGFKFFKMAQTAFSSRDFQSAKVNIQIALNTDKENPEFLQLSKKIEAELKKAKA